jgi:hypothetical protein
VTPLQRTRLYFPAWGKAFAANWSRASGRVVPVSPQPGGDWARKIEVLAEQSAAAEFRAASVDDYRHASHVVGLGRAKSSKALSNADLDRVLNLFRLLQDADQLAPAMALADPSTDERRRLLWAVSKCGFAQPYIETVCRATQGTSEWQSLSNRSLGLLVATLRKRQASRQAAAAKRPPAEAPCPDPF